MNLRRHWRLLVGAVLGGAASLLVPGDVLHRLLVGADLMFGFYLLTTWLMLRHVDPDTLARHAQAEDEGAFLIFLLALAAVSVSLMAVFNAIADDGATTAGRLLALASVPLGWVTLHTLFAQRYSHLWFRPGDEGGAGPDDLIGGLDFPRIRQPGLTEFLYYSFTIGMTFQTSDVDVTTTEMRRLTLWHAGVSFLYNTVLIALAVNAGITIAGGGGG